MVKAASSLFTKEGWEKEEGDSMLGWLDRTFRGLIDVVAIFPTMFP
jgi:hypothetical protein